MSPRLWIIFVVSAALATLGWLWVSPEREARPAPLELSSGIVLTAPRPLAEFWLEDTTGREFSRARLEGRWSLLSIGFTQCPDVCPLTLAALAAATSRLEPGLAAQTVFVSVDPARDTAAELEEYVHYFDPGFIAVTGERDELDKLCASLGFAYVHVPRGGGEYTVDHSTAVALIDPQARVAGYFRLPLDAERLAHDLAGLPPPR